MIKNLLFFVNKIFSLVKTTTEIICGLILITMILMVTVGVFYRYVLFSSRPWIPEISRFLLVGLSMFGAVIALDRDRHVSVSFVYEKFPSKVKFIFDIIKYVIIAYYSYVLIKYGLSFAYAGGGAGRFTDIPTFYPRLSLPIAGVLMLITLIYKIVDGFS